MLIARFLGAPIHITWSWLLFVAVIVPLYTRRLDDWLPSGTAIGVSIGLALMWGVSVLLHELGHVVAAKATGCEVDRVEIGFLGGATTVRGDDDSAGRELIIAATGPLVSLGLGLPGGISLLAGNGSNLGLPGIPGMFVSAITIANLAIAAFNLLPGLPLDGGRVAMALIWRATGNRLRAVVIASYIGEAIAIALVGYALWRVGRAFDPSREIPWVIALAIMSASLWSMARRSRQRAHREHELASSPLTDHLVPIDVLDGRLPASALSGAMTPLVLVRLKDGLGYADRGAPPGTGSLAQLSTPLPPNRVLGEAASRLDLLEALQDGAAPWYVVAAADGTPLGIVGASALSDR